MDKKYQRGAVALKTAQEQFNLLKLRLITLVRTRFVYLIYSFFLLLNIKEVINFLHVGMPSVVQHISNSKPYE